MAATDPTGAPQTGDPTPENTTTVTAKRKPAKLTWDEAVAKWKARGYPQGSAEGMADNMMRESGGDPDAVGDSGTSFGLFQHHKERRTALEKAAEDQKTPADDPDFQIAYADQEMQKKYPTLYKKLKTGVDREDAEDSFKRVFERPASIMWGNIPGNDKYQFSDYALKEHAGRKNTSVVMMDPDDYLALSPKFDEDFGTGPSARSLGQSLSRGEPIEAIPTLDLKADGNTATVTDQDGRHRALLARMAGLPAIPVAMRGKDLDGVTEIAGQQGTVLPHDFTPAPKGRGLADWVIPRAEAAPTPQKAAPAAAPDDDPFAKYAPPPTTEAPADDPFAKYAQPTAAVPQEPSDGALLSAAKGAAAGFGKAMLGGQQLVGKGLEAVGATAPGQWLEADAAKGVANLDQATAPDQAAHPWATGAGNIVGGAVPAMVATGGIGAAGVPMNALRTALTSGTLGGLLEPTKGENFWTEKAEQTGFGAVVGGAAHGLSTLIANALSPRLSAAARKLADMGVSLTPGQMAGGMVRRAENALASLPVVGSLIRNAERKGIEDFNKATLNEALAPIGVRLPADVPAGREAIEVAQKAAGDAYDRVLNGVTFHADQQFANDLRNLNTLVSEMPKPYQDQFLTIVRNRLGTRLAPTGTMDGQTFKQVESELTTIANGYKRSGQGQGGMADTQMGTAINEVKDALREALERTNPGKRDELAAANRTYAMLSRVEDASMNRSTADGVFTPADLLRAIKADARRTGRRKMFARGDAMMQDTAEAAQEVLPSKLPDSGTPERAMWAGLVGGAAHFEPHTAAGLALGSLPYTRPGMAAVNSLARPATYNLPADVLSRLGLSALARGAAATIPPTRQLAADAFRYGGNALAAPLGAAAAQSIGGP